MSHRVQRSRLRLPARVAAVLSVAIAVGREAHADTNRQACYDAYEQAQVRMKEGDPRKARDFSRLCARDTCPSIVHGDCVTWMEEAEKAIPTIVLQAQTDDGDATAARVLIDDVEVTRRLDGRSLEVDPGSHVIRFEIGAARRDVHVVIKEGEKSRSVVADFRTPKPGASPVAAAPKARPVPTGVWVAAGVSGAGFAAFGALAIAGTAQKGSLENDCAPFCTDEQTAPARSLFLGADIALGVGIAGAVTAVTLYVLRPEVDASERAPTKAMALRFAPVVTPSARGVAVGGAF